MGSIRHLSKLKSKTSTYKTIFGDKVSRHYCTAALKIAAQLDVQLYVTDPSGSARRSATK